jgi:hypothetical protein
MDFFCGPAVLHLDGEVLSAYAFVDSARDRNYEDWGGYIEVDGYSDVIRFRAFGSLNVYLQIPGASARDIEISSTEPDGLVFRGLGSSPLPVAAE